jgi:hypothetical protein
MRLGPNLPTYCARTPLALAHRQQQQQTPSRAMSAPSPSLAQALQAQAPHERWQNAAGK